MQCPRCKKEIEDNSLKCNFCGAKIASVCKDCGTINLITSTESAVLNLLNQNLSQNPNILPIKVLNRKLKRNY